MTFYEAALRVLESEGRPLHVQEITQRSISQNLLSHVGKTPEQTMLSRLAAMARRARDRRLVVTAKDTFALIDWAIPEDPEALAQTGVPEPHAEESLPALRPPERHPEPRSENLRGAGRPERKRRDEEGRRRRFPPISEVAFEILSEPPGSLTGEEIIEQARGRELVSAELSAEQLLTALLEDNQRRIDAGRRPQFIFSKETGKVTLEKAGAPSEAPPLELQAAFAEALGIPLEGGRPMLRTLGRPLPEEAGELSGAFAAAKSAVRDARRVMARALRRKLAELEAGTLEKSVVKLLHQEGFRELKVAKRSKEGPLLTARRKDGSLELRYAVRILRGNPAVDRRVVQELKRDLGHYSAHAGLLVTPGELRGDGRSEAMAQGNLVLLWCGDGLGDKFLDAETGVKVTRLALFELDEAFFETARMDALEAQKRREERHRDRQQQEGAAPEGAPDEAAVSAPAEAAGAHAEEPAGANAEEGEGEGEEGDEDLEAAAAFTGAARPEGAPGEGAPAGEHRRRRRRRRGRRGKGPRPEGAPGQPGAGAQAAPEGGGSREPAPAAEPTGGAGTPAGGNEPG